MGLQHYTILEYVELYNVAALKLETTYHSIKRRKSIGIFVKNYWVGKLFVIYQFKA